MALIESVVEDTGEGIKLKPKKLSNEGDRIDERNMINSQRNLKHPCFRDLISEIFSDVNWGRRRRLTVNSNFMDPKNKGRQQFTLQCAGSGN